MSSRIGRWRPGPAPNVVSRGRTSRAAQDTGGPLKRYVICGRGFDWISAGLVRRPLRCGGEGRRGRGRGGGVTGWPAGAFRCWVGPSPAAPRRPAEVTSLCRRERRDAAMTAGRIIIVHFISRLSNASLAGAAAGFVGGWVTGRSAQRV